MGGTALTLALLLCCCGVLQGEAVANCPAPPPPKPAPSSKIRVSLASKTAGRERSLFFFFFFSHGSLPDMLACTCPCNDNNPCTADSCDPVLGCIYTPLTVTRPFFGVAFGPSPLPAVRRR